MALSTTGQWSSGKCSVFLLGGDVLLFHAISLLVSENRALGKKDPRVCDWFWLLAKIRTFWVVQGNRYLELVLVTERRIPLFLFSNRIFQASFELEKVLVSFWWWTALFSERNARLHRLTWHVRWSACTMSWCQGLGIHWLGYLVCNFNQPLMLRIAGTVSHKPAFWFRAVSRNSTSEPKAMIANCLFCTEKSKTCGYQGFWAAFPDVECNVIYHLF